MGNGDGFKKRRKKIKEELEKDLEVEDDEDSDHPVHEKYTEQKKSQK